MNTTPALASKPTTQKDHTMPAATTQPQRVLEIRLSLGVGYVYRATCNNIPNSPWQFGGQSFEEAAHQGQARFGHDYQPRAVARFDPSKHEPTTDALRSVFLKALDLCAAWDAPHRFNVNKAQCELRAACEAAKDSANL